MSTMGSRFTEGHHPILSLTTVCPATGTPAVAGTPACGSRQGSEPCPMRTVVLGPPVEIDALIARRRAPGLDL
jgi:hypothetical protein